MSVEKIKLAQDTTEAMNNLVDSDKKLQELNQKLSDLTQQYMSGGESIGFFSTSNIYFWVVLGGLVLVVFALIFLLFELRKPKEDNGEHKIGKIKYKNKEEKITNIHHIDTDYEAEEKKEKKKKGPIKIKVLKVK